jgi:hypothetical protein
MHFLFFMALWLCVSRYFPCVFSPALSKMATNLERAFNGS